MIIGMIMLVIVMALIIWNLLYCTKEQREKIDRIFADPLQRCPLLHSKCEVHVTNRFREKIKEKMEQQFKRTSGVVGRKLLGGDQFDGREALYGIEICDAIGECGALRTYIHLADILEINYDKEEYEKYAYRDGLYTIAPVLWTLAGLDITEYGYGMWDVSKINHCAKVGIALKNVD